MKKLRSIFLMLVVLATIISLASCAGAGSSSGDGGYGGGYGGGGYINGSSGLTGDSSGSTSDSTAGGSAPDSGVDFDGVSKPELMPPDMDSSTDSAPDAELPDSDDGDGGEGDKDTSEPIRLPAGQVTAGAHNDNDFYALWKTLFEKGQTEDGKFLAQFAENSWGFTSTNRIKVTLTHNDAPVVGATAVATDPEGKPLFSAVTDSNGVAYLFTDAPNGTVTLTSGDYAATADFTEEIRELSLTTDGALQRSEIIEIMFVIDVTGSMGDELEYLKAEIEDVVDRVSRENVGATINLALLFYRDHGDKEVFKYHDFVNVTTADGLALQQAAIDAQRATGGGDWPEAVDEALELAVSKQWLDGATTKLIFHVFDAPPHSKTSNVEKYNTAIIDAAEKGIRYCPIICSGADLMTEYISRQAAIYTGGTFIFITDDSGIGGEHHDPSIPDVTVELLNSLLVRLINGYYTGTFAEPIDWRQEVK